MKQIRYYLMMVAAVGLLFTSCSKDENNTIGQESATLTFGAALQDFNNTNKQGECVDGDPAFAQIFLEYGDANTPLTVIVPILQDGNGYFTAYDDELEIPVPSGEDHVSVTLTDFVVWADNDNDDSPDTVLWVAPKVGSEYAQFVTNPIGGDNSTWQLRAGSKTYYDVEVLCFDNRDVNRYGYQFFDITPTELQNICFFANYCPTGPNGRDYVANYSLDLYLFTGTPETESIPNPAGSDYDELYSNVMLDGDEMGIDNGNYWADPLCVNIPMLEDGEYIYYEATLENWNGNYPDPEETYVIRGYLSQDHIDAYVAADGNSSTIDYAHLFFNCDGETPGIPGGGDPGNGGGTPPGGDEPPCGETPPIDVLTGCETAIMLGDHTWTSLDLGTQWGWTEYFENEGNEEDGADCYRDGVYYYQIWAGAAQNDTDNGYYVGYVELSVDGNDVTLEIVAFDGNQFEDIAVYFGDTSQTSAAPGQFDNTDADGMYYEFTDVDGDFWFTVHIGQACPEED
jgi:hypothetical protein